MGGTGRKMLGETHGCIFWLYTDPSELEQDARILIKRRLVAFETLLGVGGLVLVILSPHIKALHHEIVRSFFFLERGGGGAWSIICEKDINC